MKPYWTNGRVVLWQGHVLDCLAAMEAGSAHCAVTSPPYWGLRDYDLPSLEWPAVSYAPMAGLPPLDIPGCDPECGHVWGEMLPVVKQSHTGEGGKHGAFHGGTDPREYRSDNSGQYCQLCGGWRGCLGLEPTVEMFVGHIVLVARALWRVLRDDGTFWLNLGSSYQDKQELGIPWRVAFALQADGWYLRSDLIWAKGVSFCPTYSGSCMPESVRDRPTKGHEYVFLLSKNKRYFYDGDAVRERMACENRAIRESRQGMDKELGFKLDKSRNDTGVGMVNAQVGARAALIEKGGRNLRTVWTINPGSYAGAHFATFSPKLVEPMIKAGTSAKGCCPECGSPWVRVTEKTAEIDPSAKGSRFDKGKTGVNGSGRTQEGERYLSKSTGWTPTCSCDAGEPVPCIVLDPFAGTFTTGEVADFLGRHSVGIELSKKYCDDHIIPRLTEPLFEWAVQEQQEPEPEIEQMGLL